MGKQRKFLIIFSIFTAAVILLTILYLPSGIVVQFNTSADGVSEFSKPLVIGLFLLLSGFVGFQLYDDKNKGDYARWYITAFVLMAVEIWIIIINI